MSKITNKTIIDISKVLGNLLTGSEITTMLNDLNLPNYDSINNRPYTSTKWKRLNESIHSACRTSQSAKPLFKAIEYVMSPSNFMDSPEDWYFNKNNLNKLLIFHGFEIVDSGKISKTKVVKTFSGAQKRLKSFNDKLDSYDIHQEIFKYCTVELFEQNYFHAIFEASKGILDRVRLISESNLDGNSLINENFKLNQPIILIRNNLLESSDDRSAYNGLKSLLKTIVYLYRNPKAHNPKLYDVTSETDAITAFTLMSLAHKTLDNCINVRDIT